MTSWSGLYDDVYTTGYSKLVDKHPARGNINRSLRKSREGLRELHALLKAGISASTGASITQDTVKRVKGNADPSLGAVNLGGARTLETRTIIASGNVSTAQKDDMLTLLTTDAKPASYVADKSGNGGGGKLGAF